MGKLSKLLRTLGLRAPKAKRKVPPAVLAWRIREAVLYAESVLSTYDRLFQDRGVAPRGCALLEIGPGTDVAPLLLLADRGVSVTIVDRFLSEWDEDYHPAFYRAFLERVGGSPSIERALGQSGYHGIIERVSAPAENLRALPDAKFDVVVSNAVLEHLYDLGAAAREMRRVSKAGAIHTHGVDFRDHRDFARPLEHLLLSRRQFTRLAARRNHEFGCQTRPLELARIFEATGYTIEVGNGGPQADERYMDDFMPRLGRSWRSSYAAWNRDDLRTLGVRYWMRA